MLWSSELLSTGFSIETVVVLEVTEGNLKVVVKERVFGRIETVMKKDLTHAEIMHQEGTYTGCEDIVILKDGN